MCGINGIYKFSGLSFDASFIQKMNDELAHRGPDATGTFQDDLVALGHQRLSIIDPSESSNQPFFSRDKRYVIVFNGEIYNYKALKTFLTDYDFKTNGDTEVVLAAYIKYGENCLQHFNGMFAFSIWDTQEKKMFIARDRLGIKPLYYVLTNEELIFSSSLKSILKTGLIEKRFAKDSLIDYLRFQTVHAPYTIIEGVFMLMPGQQLSINSYGEPSFKTYWNPTLNYTSASNSISEVHRNIRQKLAESVEKRMMADVPFGAFLSGGIDSSILVALMAKEGNTKIDTFSVVFDDPKFSEGVYANQIAQRYKTNHHEIMLNGSDFKDLIPEALSFMDHPSGDGLNTYVVSNKTRESGIKMAISGLGGDELFGGYSIFNQVPQIQAKKWLNSFPEYLRKQMGALYHLSKGTIASYKLKEVLKMQYFDMEFIYQFYRQVLMDDQIKKLLKPTTLPLNRVFEITHDIVGYNKPGWSLPSLSRISVAEIATYTQNVLLRDADQMGMANGLEVRVPFLDHELVEYVLGIRDEIKRPTTPKKLLVDTFEDLIPESIYNREKMGFSLPYDQWMRTDLKKFCTEKLKQLKKIEYFKPEELDDLWNQFLAKNKRVTWSRIWPLVVLGDWIERNGIEG